MGLLWRTTIRLFKIVDVEQKQRKYEWSTYATKKKWAEVLRATARLDGEIKNTTVYIIPNW